VSRVEGLEVADAVGELPPGPRGLRVAPGGLGRAAAAVQDHPDTEPQHQQPQAEAFLGADEQAGADLRDCLRIARDLEHREIEGEDRRIIGIGGIGIGAQ